MSERENESALAARGGHGDETGGLPEGRRGIAWLGLAWQFSGLSAHARGKLPLHYKFDLLPHSAAAVCPVTESQRIVAMLPDFPLFAFNFRRVHCRAQRAIRPQEQN